MPSTSSRRRAAGLPLRLRRPSLVSILVAVLLAAWPAAAKPRLDERAVQQRLAQLGEMAKEGRWEEVDAEAGRLVDDLRASLVSRGGVGDGPSQLVATVLSFRALAASAQDRREDALWYWALAQSLWPDLGRASLSAYGEPARLLRENRLDLEEIGCCGRVGCQEGEGGEGGDGAARLVDPGPGAGGELQPPVKIEAPFPQYPIGTRMSGQEGRVFVNAIIGEDGRIHQAIVPRYPSVAMALAAVEPLRRWRFEPARLDGEPVEAYYCLRVNFDLR